MGSTDVAGVLKPNLRLWEEIGWSAHQERAIYRGWGQHFAHMGVNTMAMKYFEKCIDDYDDAEDAKALCMRSEFNRVIARPEASLEDSKRAAAILGPWNAKVNVQNCDALYDLNQFEENKRKLHNNISVQVGTSKLPFEQRLVIVKENFKDNLGKSTRQYSMENSSKLCKIHERIMQNQKDDWNSHNNHNKECDVLSIIKSEETMVSPLQHARSQRKTKVYFQTYQNKAWADLMFLKRLRNNPIVLLEKYLRTSPERKRDICRSYDSVKKFTSMLHARSPMYNERYYRSTPMNQHFHQHNMFRIQYQTRRIMISILRNIQAMRKQKDVVRLRDYISKIMGEYFVLKTTRVLPWKMEFMNEVYNHLALSLCETYQLPKQMVSPYESDSMCHLLGVEPLKPTVQREIIFGDRSTYAYDSSGKSCDQEKAFKRTKKNLENRLHFATMPIERSYLYYELADVYLAKHQQELCLMYVRKAIDEAKLCNSKIWQFLATLLQAKSHAIFCKYERQAEVLNEAYELATSLKSPRLCTFIELCRMLNRDYMTLRKMHHLMYTKRMRSKLFNRSQPTSESEMET